MKILAIIAAIFAFLILLVVLLLSFGKVGVRIIYRDKVKVKLIAFGIPITLVSPEKKEKKEQKKKRLADCRNPDRILRKELKRQQRRIKREKAKERKKAERKKQHQQKKAKTSDNATVKPNFKENFDMILSLLKTIYRETNGSFHLRIHRLRLSIGGKDAADAAIRYGVAVSSASCLLAWIEEHGFVNVKHDQGAVVMEPNFLSPKTTVDVDIRLSIHLRTTIRMGLRIFLSFLKERKKAIGRAEQRLLGDLKKTQ